MIKPDYKNSIVNLMSSIGKTFNFDSPYKPLRQLNQKKIRQSKNVVLLIIDGMGYEQLRNIKEATTLNKYTRDKITSVSPSTTAAAITTFATGLSPKEHAITGWYMYVKELGCVFVPLRSVPRMDGIELSSLDIDYNVIFDGKTFYEKINADSYLVISKDLQSTDYTLSLHKTKETRSYRTLKGMFSQISSILKKPSRKRRFIYAYWPLFDGYCHKYGTEDKKTISHLKDIDNKISSLIETARKTNTTLIITADHGLIDANKKKILLEDHPKLKEMLSLPLTGEPRFAYCHVKAGKDKEFEKYIRTKLKKYCTSYRSEELSKQGYFGLHKENPKLKDRIGDYVIVMKNNYIILDKLAGQEYNKMIAHHGGLSKEEMYVPLILID